MACILYNSQVRGVRAIFQYFCSSKTFSSIKTNVASTEGHIPDYLYFHSSFCSEKVKSLIVKDLTVIEDFLNLEEEVKLQEEAEKAVQRLRYEPNHWDNAIAGYRETEKLKWSTDNMKVLEKVRELAFSSGSKPLRFVHVLDLQEDGVIKPHIDSIRFCGSTIAGISLMSDSVMRLQHEKEKDKVVDVLLRKRSLYVMTGTARYEYTHEILGNEFSKFRDQIIKKSRRISVICRNEPQEN